MAGTMDGPALTLVLSLLSLNHAVGHTHPATRRSPDARLLWGMARERGAPRPLRQATWEALHLQGRENDTGTVSTTSVVSREVLHRGSQPLTRSPPYR